METLNIGWAIDVVFRTTVIFLYAFLLLRLLGKRHLSHLMYTDLMVIIAFGSAVGDVMIYGESVVHMLVSMLAMSVVALLVKMLEELSSRNGTASRLIDGQARLIIDKGKPIEKALDQENISMDMLMSKLRQKEVDNVAQVKKAFIEQDGEMSVVLYRRRK
jgi:uncharacterized membrane protein YcaP (DUF421 family)